MPKKDFSFKYNVKTKTGQIIVDDKYISLNVNISKPSDTFTPLSSGLCSSSGVGGYGLDLLRRKK